MKFSDWNNAIIQIDRAYWVAMDLSDFIDQLIESGSIIIRGLTQIYIESMTYRDLARLYEK